MQRALGTVPDCMSTPLSSQHPLLLLPALSLICPVNTALSLSYVHGIYMDLRYVTLAPLDAIRRTPYRQRRSLLAAR